MKTKKILGYGIFAVMLAVAFVSCSGKTATKEQRLTGTDSFKFTVINGGTAYSVSRGTATEGNVIIPAYYRPNTDSDYLPVTAIDYGAFEGRENIINITIPSTVTKIGDRAFVGCKNLTGINIPDGVTYIGKAAFADCRSVADITIPESVTSIGEQAFDGFLYGSPKIINVMGHANQAAADRAWGENWRKEIDIFKGPTDIRSQINYLGQ
jgi:hypothetical protein